MKEKKTKLVVMIAVGGDINLGRAIGAALDQATELMMNNKTKKIDGPKRKKNLTCAHISSWN